MSRFQLPQISPLVGSTLINYFRVLNSNSIHTKFRIKAIITLVIIIIATPFHFYEWLFFRNKLKKLKTSQPPLFVIGHWRSGTTYLHHLLCCDPLAAYITTYNSVWPNNMSSQLIFKSFMTALMPDKRPGDNVKLAVEYPQEEEFAIGNLTPYSYYHFWYFPGRWKEYYSKYVRFESVSNGVKKEWKSSFSLLVKKTLINTKGKRAVFKNPVNTARVSPLIEIYPDARFIFIHRNPVIVYLSTKRFFLELFPALYFQKVSNDQICDMILETYNNLISDYFDQKSIINPKKLIEIRFTDFEAEPLTHLKSIYDDLGLDGWERAEPEFMKYLMSQQTYEQTKNYMIPQKELDQVLHKWGFAMKKWSYGIPENLQIIS